MKQPEKLYDKVKLWFLGHKTEELPVGTSYEQFKVSNVQMHKVLNLLMNEELIYRFKKDHKVYYKYDDRPPQYKFNTVRQKKEKC